MEKQFPTIVVQELSSGYKGKGWEKRLVEGFSTTLKAGEIIALMGSNGCGKSTLLRTLTGFQHPLSGAVTMNGKSISSVSMRERASIISFVSTEPVRVGNMTVYDLVGLGRYLYSGWWGNLSETDISVVKRCIALTGMEELANREVNSLSDGERQRAMIARALAQDTPVMILDEPTAFLDVRNKYEIIHLLRELAEKEKKSVIFSSHDFNITMSMADKVWLIERGRVVEGAPEELALQGSYAVLFEGSAVAFNVENGEIVPENKPERGINIIAEGSVRDWLEKGLLRKGLRYDAHAGVTVSAIREGEKLVYTLTDETGKEQRFERMYGVLSALVSE